MEENSRIRIRIFADPDPHQNVMDPQHLNCHYQSHFTLKIDSSQCLTRKYEPSCVSRRFPAVVETFQMSGWLQHHASGKSRNNLLVKTVDKKKKNFQCLRTKCGLKTIKKYNLTQLPVILQISIYGTNYNCHTAGNSNINIVWVCSTRIKSASMKKFSSKASMIVLFIKATLKKGFFIKFLSGTLQGPRDFTVH